MMPKSCTAALTWPTPTTSVSMTINGPAAILTGFFMNAAIDQQCELYIKENGLEEEVKQKIDKIFKDKGAERPHYQGTGGTVTCRKETTAWA